MGRFSDTRSAGRSNLVPYIEDETMQERHSRRQAVAEDTEGQLRVWCDEHGWHLTVHDGGGQFMMRRKKVLVEWWPSTAKLVINKNWRGGIHCHDYHKVIEQLSRKTR